METTPGTQQRRPPPAAGEGEPEAKRPRLPLSSDSSGGHRRVVLNPADCDLDFDVDGNGLQGHALHEEGFAYCWSGARATVGITGGKYCFGCRILSEQKVQMEGTVPDQQHLCCLGISRGDDPLRSLGESDHSFGFSGTGKFSTAGKFSDYGAKFGVGDTIICAVNLENRPSASIGYSLNGKWLGSAKQFDAGPKGLGVLNSAPSKLSWGSALFPHVLLKNVVVQLQFSIEDCLIPEDGYKPWSSALEDGHAIIGPSFPAPKECEVMMMVGLPASGKTTWAEKWVKDHPEKRYVLLGTNLALVKVRGLCKQNYVGRFDLLMVRATKVFNTLLSRACKTPRNYIVDQTNVYKSARKRILQPFVHFRKIAVVVFPTPDELKSRADRRFKEIGKEVPAGTVNEMLAHYVFPVSKDVPCADECFDEVTFPELGRSEAQRYLEEMKCALRSASNLSVRSGFSPFNTPSSVTDKLDPVLGIYLWSGEPLYSPSHSVPGGLWQRNVRSQKDNLQSPVQVVDTSRDKESITRGSHGCLVVGSSTKSPQQTQGVVMEHEAATASISLPAFPAPSTAPHYRGRKSRRWRPTSPCAIETDEADDDDDDDDDEEEEEEEEEEAEACSAQASTPAEDEDVSSHSQESTEENPPWHTTNPTVEATGPSPSREEVAAPKPSGLPQDSVLLPGTAAVGGHKPVPSTDFPEHGIVWPADRQTVVPFLGVETMLDTLIAGVRALFQQEALPPVEAVRTALQSGTLAYHTLGLPGEPWMAAVESTWGEFRRAHAASRLMIRQLEDEISAMSGEARELHSKAEAARGRRSAVEANQAANREKMRQYQEAARKFAAAVESATKVVQQLQAQEATFAQKDSDLQREIAARRAQVEELKRKNPHVHPLSSSSSPVQK